MFVVAALRVAEAERVEKKVARSHSVRVFRIHKRLDFSRIESCRRAHDVGVNTERVSRARRTFGTGIKPIRQPRENIDRQPGAPSNDWKDTPALSQSFRPGIPRR